MIKPSIKALTVRSVINFLLVLALVLVLFAGLNFRELAKQTVEDQALAHATLVKAGLTAHMKAGVMASRQYYLDEIRELHEINQLHVIRGDAVTAQYGPGIGVEKPVDEVAAGVFEGKQPTFIMNEFTLHPSIRAIIPYIASREGSLNCLNCHEVAEGTVLGAVDIELDITGYQRWSFVILGGILITLMIFLVLILLNTARTIQRHVQNPLEDLIANADNAYKKQQPVCPDQFATREFVSVANEINLFNSNVIAHQDMLRQKNRELEALNNEIESTLRETVYTMGVIEEQRSKETHYHTRRVVLYSQLLARKMGLTERDVELISAAAPLHDIGKLGIPDEILLKPGKLNQQEFEVMKNHARIGFTMLSHSKRDILQTAGIIALQHHEKWDGRGYPQGLQGEQIHIYGRIVALADVFDALYSPRVYKKAWDLPAVVDWIIRQRGRQFDPQLVDIFLENTEQFVAIYQQYPSDVTDAESAQQEPRYE